MQLTGGNIYLVDVLSNHPEFFNLLEKEKVLRLSPSENSRVHVTKLSSIGDQLANDRAALILSSTGEIAKNLFLSPEEEPTKELIPERTVICKFPGLRVSMQSEFLNPAAVLQVIRTFSPISNLLRARRETLEREYDTLEARCEETANRLAPAQPPMAKAQQGLWRSFGTGAFWRKRLAVVQRNERKLDQLEGRGKEADRKERRHL